MKPISKKSFSDNDLWCNRPATPGTVVVPARAMLVITVSVDQAVSATYPEGIYPTLIGMTNVTSHFGDTTRRASYVGQCQIHDEGCER